MSLKTNEKDLIAKEGYPFIAGFGLSAAVCGALKCKYTSIAFATAAAYSCFFFRNPKRNMPALKNGLVSAADGRVVFAGKAFERFFLKKEVDRISVFMSLFDVHINRAPVDGFVVDSVYNKGKFLPANVEKASLDNEQSAILIETLSKKKVVVVQIAGLVARRIATYPKPGDYVKKGDIIGLIRFGSRVDIYVDADIEWTVVLNEKVKAKESLIGVLK
ncbi:phosphatidylserine decarboxylase family protein [Hippea jasoniae]|uniref:phosphatidylserine decarboxylase family protein n=1 Tax=Hippea jasoniae TaxID=944479 RepID=UPI0005583D07|nr:phosphatidylserine decarboxylase family protein [Hippea jasoniae]